MLRMIVNCLAISRGCERDKSTIKFDRLPPLSSSSTSHLRHPLSLPSIILIFLLLSIFAVLVFLPPLLHLHTSLYLHFSLLLPKHELKGGETEISSLCGFVPHYGSISGKLTASLHTSDHS